MSTTNVAKPMEAPLPAEESRVTVQNHPVPEVSDNNRYRFLDTWRDPIDRKFLPPWPNRRNFGFVKVIGCNWSGHVVHAASASKIGHDDAGAGMGSTVADSSTDGELARVAVELTWPMPKEMSWLTHEQAATIACAVLNGALSYAFRTAVQALFNPGWLGLVEPPAKVSGEEWVYIHEGASLLGQFAIQFAALSGYKVVTTTLPTNFEFVQSLGASAVFDYRDLDVVPKVKAAAHDSIRAALDTISQETSQRISAAVIAPDGGRVMHTLRMKTKATERTDVVRKTMYLESALGSVYLGHDAPSVPETKARVDEFLKNVPRLVGDGKIRPLPIKIWEAEWSGIPAGLQYMKEGKVSIANIVYRI